MTFSDKEEVKQAFKYPLFEALARRRTRRFPAGAIVDVGMRPHTSKAPAVQLNDLETALLCWAGSGITGVVMPDAPTLAETQGTALGSWIGRTVPSACNVLSTKLFFTDDNGVFLYDPKKPTKAVEIDTKADRDKIMAYFKEDCIKLSDKRAEFLPQGAAGCMHWNVGKPGTTIFMPVVDQTEEYLNTLLVLFEGRGRKVLDDLKGGQVAGLQKWVDKGVIKGAEVTISSFEFNALMLNVAPVSAMLQNISLAAEAIGLGTVVFAGYSGLMMLGATKMSKGLGFRTSVAKDGKVNPVGLDGILEPYCPPYYKNMDEAVDAFVEKKFGSGGVFDSRYPGVIPFKDGKKVLDGYEKPTKDMISMVKDYCNYVYDTYGRFPAITDTILLREWIQVHHLDLDFYDKYMSPELLNKTHREHMDTWHK